MKKGQFNFVWIFALVAGGAILALAIYGATQAGDTMRFQSDTEVAKSISIITDPLQAGFADGSFGRISFRQETRINNICFDGSQLDSEDRTGQGFGKNDISVATRSDIGEEWKSGGGATSIRNKYIFSPEVSSGKDYYVFSKPFNFPYEVSDLIFLTSDDYCFVNVPEDVGDEIVGLNIPNIEIDNCSNSDAVRVCFGGGSGCDVIVYGSCMSGCDSVFDEGTVVKGRDDLKYVGGLMYGAIFSDADVYDCNVKRLMYRAGKIAEEFGSKADLMDSRGCGSDLGGDLNVWSGMLTGAGSEDLMSLRVAAESMDKKNNRELCGLW
ncbi:MAG: hypothetical protein KJ592_01260 [Nanoarchaeota archaeon]|nr:hypothetical protein [Nanoarchaeota archaeon]